MSILINLFLAIFVLVAALMVLIILMQRPKSEGLGAAFGAGVTENIFGAQTTNVLQKFTVWLAGIFLAAAFALTTLYAHKGVGESGLRRELEKAQGKAAASPPPASPPPASAGSPTPAGSPSPRPRAAASPAQSSASPTETAAEQVGSPTPEQKQP